MHLNAFLQSVVGCGSMVVTTTLVASCGQEAPEAGRTEAAATIVASADDVPVAYEVRGAGAPALVFVHGWSCDRSYWEGQLEPFSRDFRVVAVDLAGHGESGLGREGWTIESFGGDVAAVVEELALDQVILIGHSMGGDVIVEAARRLPGRVAGLVWVDTYSDLGTPRTSEQVQEFVGRFGADFTETTRAFVRGMFPAGSDVALVERVAMDMSAAPPTVALGAPESALTYDREVTVAPQELGLPVVAINPDNGQTNVQSLDQHGVKVVLMPNVGHFMMMEDTEAFNALLRQVVDDLLP